MCISPFLLAIFSFFFLCFFFFFFNDTATTEIYTLSLHDALPILQLKLLTTYIPKTSAFTLAFSTSQRLRTTRASVKADRKSGSAGMPRPISYAVFCLKKKKKNRKKCREKKNMMNEDEGINRYLST